MLCGFSRKKVPRHSGQRHSTEWHFAERSISVYLQFCCERHSLQYIVQNVILLSVDLLNVTAPMKNINIDKFRQGTFYVEILLRFVYTYVFVVQFFNAFLHSTKSPWT
jgi:hypothetical protein